MGKRDVYALQRESHMLKGFYVVCVLAAPEPRVKARRSRSVKARESGAYKKYAQAGWYRGVLTAFAPV